MEGPHRGITAFYRPPDVGGVAKIIRNKTSHQQARARARAHESLNPPDIA